MLRDEAPIDDFRSAGLTPEARISFYCFPHHARLVAAEPIGAVYARHILGVGVASVLAYVALALGLLEVADAVGGARIATGHLGDRGVLLA